MTLAVGSSLNKPWLSYAPIRIWSEACKVVHNVLRVSHSPNCGHYKTEVGEGYVHHGYRLCGWRNRLVAVLGPKRTLNS